MAFKFKKKKAYGEYQIKSCPFCSRQATQKNEFGLEVCYQHLKAKMEEIKCTCGSWLEQKSGKFGTYYNCLNCGNLNFQKAMEIKAITMKDVNNGINKETTSVKSTNNIQKKETAPIFYKPPSFEQEKAIKKEKPIRQQRKEITITSNDVEYFD